MFCKKLLIGCLLLKIKYYLCNQKKPKYSSYGKKELQSKQHLFN